MSVGMRTVPVLQYSSTASGLVPGRGLALPIQRAVMLPAVHGHRYTRASTIPTGVITRMVVDTSYGLDIFIARGGKTTIKAPLTSNLLGKTFSSHLFRKSFP